MRLLLEIILAAAIIALAWEKSLKDRASELPWIGDKIAPVVKTPDRSRSSALNPRSAATPAPTASGAWMWDKERKTTLDRPAYKDSDKDSKTFTGHVFYEDEAGKKYWIDGQGKRHYEG